MQSTGDPGNVVQKTSKSIGEITGIVVAITTYLAGLLGYFPGPFPKTASLLFVVITSVALWAWRWPRIAERKQPAESSDGGTTSARPRLINFLRSVLSPSDENFRMPFRRRQIEFSILTLLGALSIIWAVIQAPIVIGELTRSSTDLPIVDCITASDGIIIADFGKTTTGQFIFEQRIYNEMKDAIKGDNICRLHQIIQTNQQSLDAINQSNAWIMIWGLSDQAAVDIHVKAIYFEAADEVIWAFTDDKDFEKLESEHIAFLSQYIIAIYNYLDQNNDIARATMEQALESGKDQDWAAKYPDDLADGYALLGEIISFSGSSSPDSLEAARDAYARAIALNPALERAILNHGTMCGMLGDIDCAMQDFTTLIESESRLAAAAYINRAELQPTQEQAEADLQEAINLRPSIGYYARAEMRVQWGDWEGAISDFQQAIELDPQNCYTRHELGIAFLLSGHYDSAISTYQDVNQCLADNSMEGDAEFYMEELQSVCSEHVEACAAIDTIKDLLTGK